MKAGEAIAKMIWLAGHSPIHREWSIDDVHRLFLPAIASAASIAFGKVTITPLAL